MNKTKTPTANKKTFPLRLPPDIYKKVRDRVQKEKDKGNYAYSIFVAFLLHLIYYNI